MATRVHRTPEETQSLIQELQEKAEGGIVELLGSPDWSAWLKWSAAFWRYSFTNQILIFSQLPTATQVAGFHKWIELGRHVRKGETAIRIFAPVTVKKSADDEGPDERVTRFRAVPVFDISQTDGKGAPKRPQRGSIAIDNPAIPVDYQHLWDALTSQGIVVSVGPASDAIGGYYQPPSTIVLSENPDISQRFRVLLHEAAHYLADHKAGTDRKDGEVQAEMAAYIAAGALGYDISAVSFGYVAAWAQDHKVLKQNASAVIRVAQLLISIFDLSAAN